LLTVLAVCLQSHPGFAARDRGWSATAEAVGDLDPGFNGSGKQTTDFAGFADRANAAALQPDGKIVVVGVSNTATDQSSGGTNTNDFALARYNPDGSLDATFGTGGKVRMKFFNDRYAEARDVAIQSDGKIVVVGSTQLGTNPFGGATDSDFALARYNPDGSLDGSFGSGGKVNTSISSFFGEVAHAVVIQPDGKIVIAGSTTAAGDGTPSFAESVFAVLRYNANGTVDTSFGAGGKVLTDFGDKDQGLDVAVELLLQPDGKLVALGSANNTINNTNPDPANFRGNDFALARYNPNGSPDATFGSGGKVTTDFNGRGDGAAAAILQPDGKIVVVGSEGFPTLDTDTNFALARYNSNGSLDAAFGNSGKVTTDFFGSLDGASGVVLQSDGRIVVGGGATTEPATLEDLKIDKSDFALARYTASGVLDTTFSGDGKLTTDFFAFGDGAQELLLQPDGKLLAVGSASTGTSKTSNPDEETDDKRDFALARYSGDSATPNPTPTPTASPTPPANRFANISTRLRVETGENVLIGGFIVQGNTPKKVLIRGLGPSLEISDALPDPTLTLVRADGAAVFNDDWKDSQEQEIRDTTIPPRSDLEAAIVATLPAGANTVALSGFDGATGVGLVEVYDLESGAATRLANISTRGRVQTGDNVMIGGFIVSGDSSARVLLRAIGPSLERRGVSGTLQDPTLQLVDEQGNAVGNDNWREAENANEIAAILPPEDDRESAIIVTLTRGLYTAVVRGRNDTTGVALVEAYNLSSF
jgi:uncharacterized delta-60 repeat protein